MKNNATSRRSAPDRPARQAAVRSASRGANPSARCQEGTVVRSRAGTAEAAAASARRKYSPEPSDDWWGVSTTPTTRATPASTRAATPSSMVGRAYLVP